MTARIVRVPVGPGPEVRLPAARLVRLLVPVGLLALLVAAGCMVAIASGEPVVVALGVVLLALVVLVSATVVQMLLGRRRGRLEVDVRPEGLTLPPSRAVRWLAGGAAGLGLAFALLLLVAGLVGVDVGPRLASPGVGLVLAVVIVVGLLRRPRGGGPSPRVVIGPEGVTRWSGGTATSLAWGEIGSVRLETSPAVQVVLARSLPRGQGAAAARPASADRGLALPTSVHSSDPAVVEAVIRHYWTTPRDRPELGTDAALERIERGELHG